MLLLPILGVLFLSIHSTVNNYHTSSNLSLINEQVLLSRKISALVHEFQKERGMTAGFLSSGGSNSRKK